MARPKKDDPRTPITIRIRESKLDWWEEQAAQRGTTARVLMAEALEAKADKG